MTEKLETIKGSGNVFRDFGYPNADVEQLKSQLAAEIIQVLDNQNLSVRKAAEKTGFDHADFSRIRNAIDASSSASSGQDFSPQRHREHRVSIQKQPVSSNRFISSGLPFLTLCVLCVLYLPKRPSPVTRLTHLPQSNTLGRESVYW